MKEKQETVWRVIPLETHAAAMNMAIDEAISNAVAAGKTPPTIRFYRWQPSAVSIGYFQSLAQEVAMDTCSEQGVDVVRRRTGGGAVYHDYAGEVTYSVIAPEGMFPKGIIDSYHIICGWVIASLKNLGLDAQFHPINDVLVGGKKISGNAQTRRGGALLQHGTVLYDVDVEKMFSLLKVGKEKIADKLIADVKQRVTRVLDHTSANIEEVYRAMLDGFTRGKEWEHGMLAAEEEIHARELAASRYASDAWNGRR